MKTLAPTLSFVMLSVLGCDPAAGTARAQSASQERGSPNAVGALASQETERIGTGGSDQFKAISPDGRYAAGINWGNGDFRLTDLQTGEVRDVTGKGYDAGRYAWNFAFSPDGRRIAISWYNYEVGGHELRVMNPDGTDSRLLVPANRDLPGIDPLDWSPDGDDILVMLGGEDVPTRIGLVSTEDGSLRILKTLGWRLPGVAAFSMDGRYIAWDYTPDLDEDRRDVYALEVAGGRETTLVSGPADQVLLGWLPDGSGILFRSDEGGTPGIWQRPVDGGRPVGSPELVHSDAWGLSPVGFTHGGYVYKVLVETPQVHTAAIDEQATRILASPRPVDDPPYRQSLTGDWSPDGTRLAYVASYGKETLIIRSVGGELSREIPIPPELHTNNGTLRWVSEESILLLAVRRGEGQAIFRVDLRDGAFRRVYAPRDGDAIKFFEPGPAGREVYFSRRIQDGGEGERYQQIVSRELEGGTERVIAEVRGDDRTLDGRYLAVSPDGGRVAYPVVDEGWPHGQSELRVASASGSGPSRSLHVVSGQHLIKPVAWTADGTRLLFGINRPDDATLWSIEADGGEPVRLGEFPALSSDLRVHPDGRRIASVGGDYRNELWILKDF